MKRTTAQITGVWIGALGICNLLFVFGPKRPQWLDLVVIPFITFFTVMIADSLWLLYRRLRSPKDKTKNKAWTR